MLRRLQRRAFTLIEIIVVATLISLLSGIALFSINEMYISNIRKVSFAEAFQLATALSIAENDLNFYPSLNRLRQAKELVLLEEETTLNNFAQSNTPSSMIPQLDYWGIYRHDSPAVLRIISQWKGPYMGVSQARQNSNRSAQSGLVKMRLPYLAELVASQGAVFPGGEEGLVDWPADNFGNPYLLYQFRAVVDDDAGAMIPLFLEDPGEDASWRNMIVSYGRNSVPGGNDRTPAGFAQNTLLPGALYVEGDWYSDLLDPGETPADFTLKVMDKRTLNQPNLSVAQAAEDDAVMAAIESRNAELLLSNDPADVAAGGVGGSQHYLVLRSLALETMESGSFNAANGQVGVIDDGSDDIILEF